MATTIKDEVDRIASAAQDISVFCQVISGEENYLSIDACSELLNSYEPIIFLIGTEDVKDIDVPNGRCLYFQIEG